MPFRQASIIERQSPTLYSMSRQLLTYRPKWVRKSDQLIFRQAWRSCSKTIAES
jgi:hypothetical protein